MRRWVVFVGALITFLAFVVSFVGALFMTIAYFDSYRANQWGVWLTFFGMSVGLCGLAVALFGIALEESPMPPRIPIRSPLTTQSQQSPPDQPAVSHMTCVECNREIPSDAIICPYCRHEYEKSG